MAKVKTLIKRLRRRRHPVKFLFARLLWQSSVVSLVPITIDRGLYKLHFFPSKLSADFWSDPTLVRMEDSLLRAYLKPGDIVVDVGANIGAETLTASALVGETGQVYAIEPQPQIFKFLTANIALNKFTNVEALNLALDEVEGTVSFSDELLDTSNRVLSRAGAIPAHRLDTIVAQRQLPHIDLLKIDVEGYEYNVLGGAPDTLLKTSCVYFEHIPSHYNRYNHTEEEIFDNLYRAKFRLFRLRDDDKNVLAVRQPNAFNQRTKDVFSLRPV